MRSNVRVVSTLGPLVSSSHEAKQVLVDGRFESWPSNMVCDNTNRLSVCEELLAIVCAT